MHRLLIALSVSALLLAACGGTATPSADTSTATPAPTSSAPATPSPQPDTSGPSSPDVREFIIAAAEIVEVIVAGSLLALAEEFAEAEGQFARLDKAECLRLSDALVPPYDEGVALSPSGDETLDRLWSEFIEGVGPVASLGSAVCSDLDGRGEERVRELRDAVIAVTDRYLAFSDYVQENL